MAHGKIEKRGQRRRKIKPVILIVTEGSQTEPKYFEHYRNRQTNIDIRVVGSRTSGGETDYLSLIRKAVEYQNKNQISVSEGDSVWVVADGDVNYNNPDPITAMKTLDPKKAENKAEKAAVNGSAEAATVSAPSVQIDLSKVKIEPLFADDVDFETFSKSDFRVVKIEACEAVPKSKKLLKFTLNDGTDRKRTILSGIHEYYEPEELVGKTCVAITNLPPRKMMGIDSEGMLISAVYEYDGREGLNLLMLDDSIPAGAKLY